MWWNIQDEEGDKVIGFPSDKRKWTTVAKRGWNPEAAAYYEKMLKVEEEDRKTYNEYINSQETDNSTRVDVFKYEACEEQEEDNVERVLNDDEILDLWWIVLYWY